MNNGKICVSVCAETADELIEQIKRAENLADVIEIRFDCLEPSEGTLGLSKISNFKFQNSILATLRIENKSAEFFFGNISNQQILQERTAAFWRRIRLWKKILSLDNLDYLDFEDDLFIGFMKLKIFDEKVFQNHEIIFSHHDFTGTYQNLIKLYQNFSYADEFNIKCDIIKIAVQANEITDSIPVWKLLESAKSENKEIIPISMGEAGKWTRILGLAHGAFLTYAALDSGKETAPGQVSAEDLIEVYRAKELDENTEVYGIIGNPVSQSVSSYMQNAAFKFHNLNAVYIPFEVANLDEFIEKFVREETREVELNLKGFSVTIPHKQAILNHLDFIDEDAQKIGAVNTIKIMDGKIYGYNTDAHGFIEPLKNAYGDLNNVKVAVIGNGGAARACVYALKKENADVTIFARNPEKAENLASEFNVNLKKLGTRHSALGTQEILVNATPSGMKGKFENETPFIAEQLKGLNLVYDLVFNPFETKLLSEADKANVPKIGGLAMLIAQGMQQFEIWTGKNAPLEEMSRAALKKLK